MSGGASESRNDFNINELLIVSSETLDDIIFDPLYKSQLGEFEQTLCNRISDFKTFSKIERQLRPVKVGCFTAGILCIGISIGQYRAGNFIQSLMYGLITADLMKISYNSYIKTYCSNAARKLGGDVLKLGESIYQWLQSAVGLNPGKDDPFSALKKEVMWDVVFQNTFCEYLFVQAFKFAKMQEKKKRR